MSSSAPPLATTAMLAGRRRGRPPRSRRHRRVPRRPSKEHAAARVSSTAVRAVCDPAVAAWGFGPRQVEGLDPSKNACWKGPCFNSPRRRQSRPVRHRPVSIRKCYVQNMASQPPQSCPVANAWAGGAQCRLTVFILTPGSASSGGRIFPRSARSPNRVEQLLEICFVSQTRPCNR